MASLVISSITILGVLEMSHWRLLSSHHTWMVCLAWSVWITRLWALWYWNWRWSCRSCFFKSSNIRKLWCDPLYYYRLLRGTQLWIKCTYRHGPVLSQRNKDDVGGFPFQGCREHLRGKLGLCLNDSIHLVFMAPLPNMMGRWGIEISSDRHWTISRGSAAFYLRNELVSSEFTWLCLSGKHRYIVFSQDEDCCKEPFSSQWRNLYWRQISSFPAGLPNPEMMCTNESRRDAVGMKGMFESHPSL